MRQWVAFVSIKYALYCPYQEKNRLNMSAAKQPFDSKGSFHLAEREFIMTNLINSSIESADCHQSHGFESKMSLPPSSRSGNILTIQIRVAKSIGLLSHRHRRRLPIMFINFFFFCFAIFTRFSCLPFVLHYRQLIRSLIFYYDSFSFSFLYCWNSQCPNHIWRQSRFTHSLSLAHCK